MLNHSQMGKGGTMYISTATIINVAALVTALITIGGILFSIFKWFQKQKQQDIDIKSMKEENTLLCYGLMACLDGLQQLGANHTVPVAKDKLEKYLNQKAHDQI